MYIGDISEMMDNLGCITDGNNIVPITAAMGCAVQNDNSTKDINEIIHEADSRMYEEKRSMKHRKGEYPKVCVNLQTDVRYNYSVWRLFLWQEEKTAHKKQQ